MRSRLFRIAWSIAKHYSTFAEALRVAWQTIKLQWALCLGVVTFTYKKIDGSIRTATGTNDHGQQLKGSDRPKNYGVLTYWDIPAGGFRSCLITNIIFN